MEANPSCPAELAAWCEEQVEYVTGVLDTYDLSLWDDSWGPARRHREGKPEPTIWVENVRAGNRLRTIDADLRSFVAVVCPGVLASLLEIDHSPFREAHKVLANLQNVLEACEADGQGDSVGNAADREPGSGWGSVKDLAERYKVSPEPLRKRLSRWRRQNGEGWMEVAASERKSNEPQFLYRHDAVQPLIDALRNRR